MLAVAAAMALLAAAGCEIGVDPSAETTGPENAENILDHSAARSQDLSADGASTAQAQGRLRFVNSYAAGRELALREGKPMLVFFTASWCHYCHQMAEEAFRHPQVVHLADQFICVLVDADAERQTCEQFQVSGYPTIWFLSPRGVPINRLVGKTPGRQLVMAMQSALQTLARRDDNASDSTAR